MNFTEKYGSTKLILLLNLRDWTAWRKNNLSLSLFFFYFYSLITSMFRIIFINKLYHQTKLIIESKHFRLFSPQNLTISIVQKRWMVSKISRSWSMLCCCFVIIIPLTPGQTSKFFRVSQNKTSQNTEIGDYMVIWNNEWKWIYEEFTSWLNLCFDCLRSLQMLIFFFSMKNFESHTTFFFI